MISRIKTVPFFIAAVILIIALVATVKAMTAPTTTTTEQTVTLLNYQQEGKFDYKAYVEPAYFYGTYQDIPASLQLPLSYIESLEMNYEYRAPDAGQVEVEINAVLENPNNWQKVVTLAPKQATAGGFSVPFPVDLKYLQGLADIIDKEWGSGSSSHNINIIATVYGKDTVFTQTLPVKMTRTSIVIDNSLVKTQRETIGVYSYRIKLSENTIYGATTISSPPVTVNLTPTVVGPGSTVFTRLIDSLNFTYEYNITADRPLQQVETKVWVDAVLENPEKWSKTLVLVPVTKESGNFTISFPLDLAKYTDICNTIQQETGVTGSSYNLTLNAEVSVKAQTDAGPVEQLFSHSIKTDLKSGILTWDGDLLKSEPGNIETRTNVTTQAKVWGIPVFWARTLSIVVLLIVIIIIVALLVVPGRKTDNKVLIKQYARQTEQKYKNMIIRVNELPRAGIGDNILTVDSLDELVKIAQVLLKPINHTIEENLDVYWLIDASTLYEYRIIASVSPVREAFPGPSK